MTRYSTRLYGWYETYTDELRMPGETQADFMRRLVSEHRRMSARVDYDKGCTNTVASDPYRKPTFWERLLNWRRW